jgi:exosortase/archaeosortase family protein
MNMSSALSAQLIMVFMAFWPVWLWYGERLIDGSDDPVGVLALLTLSFVVWWKRKCVLGGGSPSRFANSITRYTTAIVAGLLLVYCMIQAWAPPFILAMIALAVIGLCLARIRNYQPTAGDWALLLLSLPVVASLNFYFGYPLRMLACWLASVMLNLGGLAVFTEDAAILSNNSVVGIDPPCGGVKLLWATMYVAATLSSMRRLAWLSTVKVMLLAVLVAVIANALRVSSLFYVESGIVEFSGTWHSFVHAGVGVAVFVLSAVAVFVIVYRPSPAGQPVVTSAQGYEKLTLNQTPLLSWGLVLACVAAFSLPLLIHSQSVVDSRNFGGWPTTFENRNLTPIQLSGVTARFAEGFPGKIAVFSVSDTRVVYRWLPQPTRQLHPASNCYKAGGYEINWLPAYTDNENQKWTQFEATKGSEKLQVRERLYDEKGQSWTDVSSWYWAAMLRQSEGPWWTVTITDRLD